MIESNSDVTHLLPSDRETIREILAYVATEEIDMEGIQTDFEKKTWWGLFWDSKAPKNSYALFKLTPSDKTKVKGEVAKYQEYYGELVDVLRRIVRGELDECQDPYEMIARVYAELKKKESAAVIGEKTTDSRTVSRVHNRFLSSQLEHKVRNVECAVLRRDLRQTVREWQKSITTIDNLKTSHEAEWRRMRDDREEEWRRMRDDREEQMKENRAREERQLKENRELKEMIEELSKKITSQFNQSDK